MTRIIKLAVFGLFLTAPATADDWVTLYDGYNSIAVVTPATQDGGSVRVQMIDFLFDPYRMIEDMDGGREPNRNRFTATRSEWTIDCKQLRVKSENTARREGLNGRWQAQPQQNISSQPFAAGDIEQDPLLAYACMPAGERAAWKTPEQARDAKWNRLVKVLRDAAESAGDGW